MLLAHNVGGGALPAPPWLLGCFGAFAVSAMGATWAMAAVASASTVAGALTVLG